MVLSITIYMIHTDIIDAENIATSPEGDDFDRSDKLRAIIVVTQMKIPNDSNSEENFQSTSNCRSPNGLI